MTYSFYIGGISASFRNNWTAHTTKLHQWEPDAFDIFTWYEEIPEPDWIAGGRFFTDGMKADWGAWASKITKEKAMAYNECVAEKHRIPDRILRQLKEGEAYAVIEVEDIHCT